MASVKIGGNDPIAGIIAICEHLAKKGLMNQDEFDEIAKKMQSWFRGNENNMAFKTVCNKCGDKTNCENDKEMGFLCPSCEIKFDKKARKRLEIANWMNSHGAVYLLAITAASLVVSAIFHILQYFKNP